MTLPWAVAFVIVLAGIAACGVVCVRGNAPSGAIALQAASTAGVAALLLLAIAAGPAYLYDPAIVFAVLSFTGGLLFIHYMEAL